MEDLIRQLSHIGLSAKEASVYISALEIGPSVVQDIAKKAGVNRATTYVMIESLAGRGLVSTFVKGKKRYFAAESPDRLASLLRLQKREIEEREKEIEGVIPVLNAMFNAEGSRPQVRYLEGRDGILSVMKTFQEIEGEWVEIVAMDDVAGFEELMAGHRSEHLEELKKRGAPHRVLAVMKEPDFDRLPSIPNGEVRVVPADKFPIHGDVVVRGHTVFLYSLKQSLLGIVVTSQEIAETVRALFDLAWEGAAQYPSKKR